MKKWFKHLTFLKQGVYNWLITGIYQINKAKAFWIWHVSNLSVIQIDLSDFWLKMWMVIDKMSLLVTSNKKLRCSMQNYNDISVILWLFVLSLEDATVTWRKRLTWFKSLTNFITEKLYTATFSLFQMTIVDRIARTRFNSRIKWNLFKPNPK